MSGSGATSRSSGSPDEPADKGRARIEVVDLGGFRVKRQAQPGRRLSTGGGDSGQPRCDDTHVGYVASGQILVLLEGGEELDIRAGDVLVIPPGQAGWTLGEEPCVIVRAKAA
jgi:hypothetical protein